MKKNNWKITYKDATKGEIRVYLDGKRVGTIKPVVGNNKSGLVSGVLVVDNGFAYYPIGYKGKQAPGEIHPTIALVKRDIELE